MPLTATNYTQLVNTTLKNLGSPNYTDISSSLQHYTVLKNLALVENRRTITGYGIQFNVNVNYSNSATVVGMGEADNIGIQDSQVQASVNWPGRVTANFALMEEAISMNKGPEQIVEMVQVERNNMLIGLAELFESHFWGPPVASTDSLTPWGAKTWFPKNSTEGFNGGMPSGYTTVGLSSTTYPAWKHWTAQYTNVSKDDFVRKARQAAVKTNFKPPVDSIPSPNTGDKMGCYMNYALLAALEELLEAQNQNLGRDLASQDGKTLFRGMECNYVPKLDADTTNPFYCFNWGWFKFYILDGWWMKETVIPHYPGQHTISARFYDCIYQTVCKNRREGGFVLATGTSEPS